MTTTTVLLALDSYDTVIAIEDNSTNGMVAITTGTATGDADYLQVSMVISDQSEAYDTFRDSADDTQKDAIKDYTDGYAITAKIVVAAELFEGTVVAEAEGVTMENDFCITGTISAEDANSDGTTAVEATSCAVMSATCTGDGTAGNTDSANHTCVYTAGSSLYGTKYIPTDESTTAEWSTPITDATGYAGGWIWTASTIPASATYAANALNSAEMTLQAGRMFPKLEKKTYESADLRFSGDVTGKMGWQLNGAGFLWSSATWAGAAQVASVAAAAAVVALTF